MTRGTMRKHKRKKSNFTTIYNKELKNKEMSWKATGIYSYLCSLPDDWDINVQDIINQKKDGRDAVLNGLKELEEQGYVHREEFRNDKGQFQGVVYHFFEIPIENIFLPQTGNPITVNPTTEKPEQQIKNLKNKDLKNNNISKDILSVNTDFEKKYNELKEKSVLVDNGKYALSDFSFIGKWFLNPSESESQNLLKTRDRVASIFLQLVNKETNEFGITKAQCHGYYKILFRYMMVLERFPSDEEIKYLVSLRKKMSNATQPSKLETVFSQMKKKGLSLLDKNIEPLVIENMQLRASFGQKKQSVQPGTVKNRNETAEDFSNIRDLGGSFDEL